MRKVFWLVAGVVIAIGIAMTAVGTAQAAPIAPAAAASQAAGSLVTPVHCRRYRHCHRRCWWRNGFRRCGRFCHRCG
jgi:hypothetical protein